MKRFAALFLLLALASSAHASGVALRWNSCAGASNRTFACDRSTGSEMLVGSFDPPSGVNELSGMEVILSIAAADGTTPSWWQSVDPSSCRRGSIAASFDVSDQSECEDPWNGQAVGGIGAASASRVSQTDIPNPAGVDLYLVCGLPALPNRPPQLQGVSSGRTYAAFKLIINHQKSNGSAACAGCDTPVCITIDAIRLSQPSVEKPDETSQSPPVYSLLTDGISGMGGQTQVATWQGGTANCGAGLSKPSTWSALKDRFRSK